MGKWVLFIVGIVVGAVGVFAWFVWMQMRNTAGPDDDLMFAEKNFFEFQDMSVYISGTLTGEGLGYPNNTYAISCIHDKGDCWIASVEQIGPKHVGRMDNPYSIPITKWDKNEIVASEEPSMFACVRTILTINRFSKEALLVYMPVNQTKPDCAKSESKIRKYTIEDSIGWKRLNARLRGF
jgi:hypothetical protein